MTDMVNHPPHYESNGPPCAGCGRPIQCIEVRESMTANISDAQKYLWRQGSKPGVDPIQDLEKSVWYIEREIARLRAGGAEPTAINATTPYTVTVTKDGFKQMVATAIEAALTELTDALARQGGQR